MAFVGSRKKVSTLLYAFAVCWGLFIPLHAYAASVGDDVDIKYGHLQVNIEPADASLNGAKWRLLDGVWNDSGDVLSELPVGDHLVEFALIPGYQPPALERVTVDESGATVTVQYRHLAGSITVSLSPPQAIAEGAGWRVDGSAWQQSEMVLDDLEEGLHSIEFKKLERWHSPPRQMVWVDDSRLSVTAGSYAQIIGSLTMVLNPPEVVAQGALWRIQGDVWQESGDALSTLPMGMYTIEFSDVPGWQTPPSQKVSVSEPLMKINVDYAQK